MWSPGVRHFNKVKFTQDFNYQLISLNKYSKTWKSLDFVKLLHWICKVFKVLFVNQSAWYHHEKVNHFCKFYQLEISELCFFALLDCTWLSVNIAGNIVWKPLMMHEKKFYHWEFWGVRNFFFHFPHWLVHLAVNSFHKSLCIAARGEKHKSL